MTDEESFARCLASCILPLLAGIHAERGPEPGPATSALSPEEWEANSPQFSGLEGRGRLQKASERCVVGLRSVPGTASAEKVCSWAKGEGLESSLVAERPPSPPLQGVFRQS